MEKERKYHIVNYGTYVLVWVGLLILTGITVTVSGMELGSLNILTALFIASFKSGLVLCFFMHLKYERRLFKIMLSVVVITIAVIIGLTFFDISYR